jgi:DNA invertase Pin-like site-specific DNA recombinase
VSGTYVGYARTSTIDQVAGFEAQLAELEKTECEEIFQEQVSATGKRPRLEEALRYIRKNDTLVVTKLDRLARSVKHLGEIVEILDAKGAMLRVLNLNLDTGTPTGKLMLNMLGSVAQFEREMMLERQREGIARAKSEGKYTGRPRTTQPTTVLKLVEKGMSVKEVMNELHISRPSYYRLLNEARDETKYKASDT